MSQPLAQDPQLCFKLGKHLSLCPQRWYMWQKVCPGCIRAMVVTLFMTMKCQHSFVQITPDPVPVKCSAHAVEHLGGFMMESCWFLPSFSHTCLALTCPCLESDPYLLHQSCTSSFSGTLRIWGDNQLDLLFIKLQGFHHRTHRKII